MGNSALNLLVGGVNSATVSDETAARDGRKFMQQRASRPVFDVAVELRSQQEFIVHPNVSQSIDALLAGKKPRVQLRK
eukprot:6110545-Amphidinium_carterae.1